MGSVEVNNASENKVEFLQCQANLRKNIFGYMLPMALKSVVELNIADIIHSHGQPMSLSQIISMIDQSQSLDVTCLSRVMRFLVHEKVFTNHEDDQLGGEVLYGLTLTSHFLRHDHDQSVAPVLLMLTHPWMMDAWHHVSRSIKEGGMTPFERAHGQTLYEKCSQHSSFNKVFNNAMISLSRWSMNAILEGYKDEFAKIEGTLVDVGGGLGKSVANIVEAHPSIQGINFDLPHVVATAPQYPGVTHIGGNMFEDIPNANAIFIKRVLHNWGDEDCIRIMKNCYKALSKKKGKLIIAEITVDYQENEVFDDLKLRADLLMMANTKGGKERTEKEFGILLMKAGFNHSRIIKIPFYISIIEAYFS